MNSRRHILKTPSRDITPWSRRDGDWLVSVHRRRVDAELADRLLPALLDPSARIWPGDVWPQLVLDDGLNVGSTGGHGPIRYHVIESEPDRVRFQFDELDGWHEFRLEADAVVHEARIRRPSAQVRLFVIQLHDALLEHLLDDVAHGGGHYPARRWPQGTRWRYVVASAGRRRKRVPAARTIGAAAARRSWPVAR